jgi:hypothetical protein
LRRADHCRWRRALQKSPVGDKNPMIPRYSRPAMTAMFKDGPQSYGANITAIRQAAAAARGEMA